MNKNTLAMVGLTFFILLFLMTIYMKAGPIEEDLATRSTKELSSGGHDWATTNLSGRDLTLSGAAPSDAARSDALAIAGSVRGVRVVDDTTAVQLAVSPFVWKLIRRADTAVISGVVPDKTSKAELLALAGNVLGQDVADQTDIAPGAPNGWLVAAKTAITQLGSLQEGEALLTDTRLRVSGTAPDSATAANVTAALKERLPAGFQGESDVTSRAVAPFVWRATRTGERIALGGTVPGQAVHDDLLELAEQTFGKDNVSDNMQLSDDKADAGWLGAARAALLQMDNMLEGQAVIADNDLTFTGKVSDTADLDKIQASLQSSLPAGFNSASDLTGVVVEVPAVASNSYVWRAIRRGGKLVMSGMVPDEVARERLMTAARERFGDDVVTDRTEIAPGAPDGDWLAVAETALAQMGAVTEGEAVLRDTELTLRGKAPGDAAVMRLSYAISAQLPAGFKGIALVTDSTAGGVAGPAVDVDECQVLFTQLLLQDPVKFDTDSARIRTESYALLHDLAQAAHRCPQASVEVAGHTDSVGDPLYNVDLSQRRAQAVIGYLVESGITADRMTAAGFGDSLPVRANDTEEGRAHNRRIEFNIKK